MDKPEIQYALDQAIEAACAAVWREMWGQLGYVWPDDCPDPETFRAEEKEALLPALTVLAALGELKSDDWAEVIADATA